MVATCDLFLPRTLGWTYCHHSIVLRGDAQVHGHCANSSFSALHPQQFTYLLPKNLTAGILKGYGGWMHLLLGFFILLGSMPNVRAYFMTTLLSRLFVGLTIPVCEDPSPPSATCLDNHPDKPISTQFWCGRYIGSNSVALCRCARWILRLVRPILCRLEILQVHNMPKDL